MAYFHRLIFAALVLLTAWLPSTSYASFPATETTPAGTCTVAPCYKYALFQASAVISDYYYLKVEALNVRYSHYPNRSCNNVPCDQTSSVWYANNGSSYVQGTWANQTVTPAARTYVCPTNSTLSGTSCACNSGYTQSGSSCLDPNVNKCANAKNGVDLFSGFSSLPTVGASFCPSDGAASSCAAKVSGGFCTIKAGVKTCTHEVTYTGSTCTPPAPSPTEPSPVPTPCKGTYGQVNGVDVCLPLGTDPSVTVETGKQTETTTTPSGGGGSTTTTTNEKATCIGSMCTTEKTTTTTGPDGVPTSTTEKKTEAKDDFCKTNPRSSQCLTSSFGGSCSAAFTCDGDAVMCAITREQHTRNCKLFDDNSSAEAQLYGAEKNKAGSQTGSLPDSETIAISSSSFDTSDAIGGGSGCIADKSVTVAGAVVTIPFSTVCGHLAMLGNILLAVSFLLAGRIVVRG